MTRKHRRRSLSALHPGSDDLPAPLAIGRTAATLRRLEPADADRLIAFFATHTAETIHQRYGYGLAEMTPAHARELVGVDQTRDAALGVFEDTADGSALIAIGRYCLAADAQSAEAAFVVREDRRRRGLGTLLLRTLVNIARERGIPRLVALVQHDNPAMLAIFRGAGGTFSSISGTAGVEVEILLPPPPRPVRARSRPGRPLRLARAWLQRAGRRARQQLGQAILRLPVNPPLP